ncbi:uncharacterized protein Z520_08625 [Fonsecaea multimorphosa CBS 102226]|uniref:Xaa-Pro dipeptidyl-peptidase C-terminal domain-containing protein n=1 Tax=Fonsecaea multimorphosa CBS 102226 TaxID=1442371 RepID=A0A0D2H106_9EURO|nr:uncharacterized protein Z520_08625 [Fonsecaea multimorphosa CBS 102226]KIX95505.1 hypothetical protein Z520_08625 [Fonsecaea multimorphosa CBS 102226]OAL21351.1 hypothetical protein AYO22_08074 [Fonsecaea multimorphosa]
MASLFSFPVPIQIREHDEIRLSDNIVLSAMIWLPKDALVEPVPAILEYLPYRKRDGTAERDALNHSYIASYGYACVRVDMRGSGDSEGILLGEYLKQEQDDALEILQWIVAQDWCSGSVGMIGISWGGFNGLQVAARRPPELKAVISLCSTDDRYADDVHYMGGCLLVDNFTWGATMFSITPTPPDPALVGAKWRDLWMSRLEAGGNWMVEWHEHQRRDEFWKHASICEDYGAIQCPVYLVGAWSDGYSNTIFRMLEHLECPRKALIGPWAHAYPNFATPGPQIGFLQESLRWWDKWLKGKETGIMDEPILRCYLQDTVPPRTQYDFRPGHWVAEKSWPTPNITTRTLRLLAGRLSDELSTSDERLSICSPMTVGFASGLWCPGLDLDLPGDQRAEAGGSLLFDSASVSQQVSLLGAPIVYLRIASDKPNAIVAAVLSEILPDGSATRISFGLLNLTHRDSHTGPTLLEPGRFYDVVIKLNECGQRIGVGSRLRLALSTSYFPICWPSPEAATLTIDCAHSRLELPTRIESDQDSQLRPFEPAVTGRPLKTRVLRPGKKMSGTITEDIETGRKTLTRILDTGLIEFEAIGWHYGDTSTSIYSISPDDPLSACAEMQFKQEYGRKGLDLVVEGWNKMTATRTDFHLTARFDAFENGVRVFGRDYSSTVPRDHV